MNKMPLNSRKKACMNTKNTQFPVTPPRQVEVTKGRTTRSKSLPPRKILGAKELFGTDLPANAPTSLKNAKGRVVKLDFDFRTKLPAAAKARAEYVKKYNIHLDEHGNPKGLRANMEEDDGHWKTFTEGQRMAFDYLMRAKNDYEYAKYLAQADQLDIADQISRKKAERKRSLKRSPPVDENDLARSKLLCRMRAFNPTTPVDNPVKYQKITQPHNWILHKPSNDPEEWYFAEVNKPADDQFQPQEEPKPGRPKVVVLKLGPANRQAQQSNRRASSKPISNAKNSRTAGKSKADGKSKSDQGAPRLGVKSTQRSNSSESVRSSGRLREKQSQLGKRKIEDDASENETEEVCSPAFRCQCSEGQDPREPRD